MPWQPSVPNSIDTLQIIYKLAERCNLNCSYCYYYHLGDESALERPALVSYAGALDLANWIAQGCRELAIPNVHLSFHGGEPMLMRALEFARICDVFVRIVAPVANLHFSIQSNGTLLTEGWLEALKRYGVHVGISIDGRREDHDRFRRDHRGDTSFAATEETIKRLMVASATYPHVRPGTISVLHPSVDYHEAYRYLRGLGVRSMHFLLPDRKVDGGEAMAQGEADAIGKGLLDIFEAWLIEDDLDVQIRFISETLSQFEIGAPVIKAPRRRKSNQILVARSDNTIAIDDSLIPALELYQTVPEFPINRHNLQDVLSHPIFERLETEKSKLPDDCTGCSWIPLCGGGDLENRFSRSRGFNNSSVYCSTYKVLYRGICDLLVDNGYPLTEVRQRFGHFEHA